MSFGDAASEERLARFMRTMYPNGQPIQLYTAPTVAASYPEPTFYQSYKWYIWLIGFPALIGGGIYAYHRLSNRKRATRRRK